MKLYKIERLTIFDSDLEEAEAFKLERFGSRHTGSFLEAVFEGVDSLTTFPSRCVYVKGRTDLRQLIIDGNYRLAYEVDEENQIVVLVALKPEWHKMTDI